MNKLKENMQAGGWGLHTPGGGAEQDSKVGAGPVSLGTSREAWGQWESRAQKGRGEGGEVEG
jgi:hypothetical protein